MQRRRKGVRRRRATGPRTERYILGRFGVLLFENDRLAGTRPSPDRSTAAIIPPQDRLQASSGLNQRSRDLMACLMTPYAADELGLYLKSSAPSESRRPFLRQLEASFGRQTRCSLRVSLLLLLLLPSETEKTVGPFASVPGSN